MRSKKVKKTKPKSQKAKEAIATAVQAEVVEALVEIVATTKSKKVLRRKIFFESGQN